MLSSDDYYGFRHALRAVMKKCFIEADSDSKQKAYYLENGFTKLTEGDKYRFTEDAEKFGEEMIKICEALPRYPAIHPDSCSTIAYADLLPDDISTQKELLQACKFADAFFTLLQLNELGIADYTFKSKYGFPMALIALKYKDRLGPNRSAYVQE